jgi:preprotein translocase subunit SecF
MTAIVCGMMSMVCYTLLYYIIMPTDIQEKQLNFHVKDAYQTINQSIKSIAQPSLVATIPIGNSMAGYY